MKKWIGLTAAGLALVVATLVGYVWFFPSVTDVADEILPAIDLVAIPG